MNILWGGICRFSKLFSRKTSVETELESITTRLTSFEEQKRVHLTKEKRIAGAFLLYSLMLYFTIVALVLLYLQPTNAYHYIIIFGLIISLPFLIIYVKKFIHWFYIRRIKSMDNEIAKLKKRKREILAQVTEKETYKKAYEILNRFDTNYEFRKLMDNQSDDYVRKRTQSTDRSSVTLASGDVTITQKPGNPTKKQRKSLQTSKQNYSIDNTPLTADMKAESACDLRQRIPNIDLNRNISHDIGQLKSKQSLDNLLENQTSTYANPSNPINTETQRAITSFKKLPRPLISQNRTTFDKLIDFIVGDGFTSRYALICNFCYSHNGMALEEEFQYLSFTCAYCRNFNKAKKTKPVPLQLSASDTSSVIQHLETVENRVLSNSSQISDGSPTSTRKQEEEEEQQQQQKQPSFDDETIDTGADTKKKDC